MGLEWDLRVAARGAVSWPGSRVPAESLLIERRGDLGASALRRQARRALPAEHQRLARFLPDMIKEQVRSRTDLVGLVAESVTLRPLRGGRDYVGLCPFHDDHNPSFHVYPDRQTYRCWACNAGGDCFSFVMQRDRLEFFEAMRYLAERAGIDLPRRGRDEPRGPQGSGKQRLYELLAWAENEFHQCLVRGAAGERARRYLRERGISAEMTARFRLGYHPDNWEWLLDRARGTWAAEDLVRVALVRERDDQGGYRDCFVDRVLFPIRDAQRRPVAFGGRLLPDTRYTESPKYWNSPEHALFQKSRLLYGLDEAREAISRSSTAVVVEGYTDCILAHQHGQGNVVGTLGTALNESHVIVLKRFARNVVLVYDGDQAGQSAAERALPKFLAHEIDLRVAVLPSGMDPADYVVQFGGQKFREVLDAASEAWEQHYRATVARHGLESLDARHRVLAEMLSMIAQVPVDPRSGLARSWRERESVILGRLAQRLKISEEFMRLRLRELRLGAVPRGEPARPADAPEALRSRKLPREMRAEIELLQLAFLYPECLARAASAVTAAQFTHPGLRALWEACLGLAASGSPAGFDRVMALVEDPALKALAVEVDELGRGAKLEPSLIEPLLTFFDRQAARPRGAAGGPHLPRAKEASVLDDQERERLRQATQWHRSRSSKSTMP